MDMKEYHERIARPEIERVNDIERSQVAIGAELDALGLSYDVRRRVNETDADLRGAILDAIAARWMRIELPVVLASVGMDANGGISLVTQRPLEDAKAGMVAMTPRALKRPERPAGHRWR